MPSMKQIVAQQRDFFRSHQTLDLDFRLEQLKRFQAMLTENQQRFQEGIFADFKKSPFDTYIGEMALLFHDVEEAMRHLKRWSASQQVQTNLINFPAKSYIMPEPLGVALVIGAWNYPYQLSLAPVIPAIAAGNTIILKPSELPTHTSHVMAELVAQYFEPDFFTVVEGGVPETTELLEQQFDKIFFTGSVPVGKIIYEAAAKHLTPVTLELGGKSPAILTKDCNLEVAVQRLIWAKFLNAGQTCIAPDYVVVPADLETEFLEQAKAEIEASRLSFANGNYVQIINDRNTQRLLDLIEPEKVVYGGGSNATERYIEPTLMANVSFADKVMEDEIFGPILPVIRYTDLDEILKAIQLKPKPLACYLFTHDTHIKRKVLRELSFGGGAVNDAVMHILNPALPFGGVGHSGIGNYHGEAGFRAFSHYKSVLEKPTWLEPDLKYYPHTPQKLNWIKRLMGQGHINVPLSD